MDLARAHDTLARALRPAAADLDGRQRRTALRYGLDVGIATLPKLSAGLLLGYLGGWYLVGERLFEPLALPMLLLLVPLASALAFWWRARGQPVDAYAAALVLDHNERTKDRLSAALELSADERSGGEGRRAALSRAAVADGVACVERVDIRNTDVPQPKLAWRVWSALFALLLAVVPAVLEMPERGKAERTDVPTLAGASSAGETSERTNGNADEPAGDPGRRRDGTETREPGAEGAEEDSPEHPREKERPRIAESERGSGSDSGGAHTRTERGERSPSGGAAQAAASGSPSSGGQGGAGQGASQSENEPTTEPRERKKGAKASSKPRRQAETKAGERERSSATPSGPSRGGGKMAAVGNERPGLERGTERDEDVETEDEEIEDEDEESEQRGGIMPMTRDRKQATSRELSISGNGPPDDGRGGPTPPKKSRGTASLVLGIRLPDQVRGRPNPGTAKTSIEQVPPKPQHRAAGRATPAPTDGPSAWPQTPAATTGDLAEPLRRYHELLRRRARPGGAAAPEPDEGNE